MDLLALLWRDSRGTAGVAVAAGAIGGAGGVGLIALIQASLNRGAPSYELAWAFAGLCVVVLLTRIASQAILIRLSQGTLFRLHEQLSRQILAAPLRTLEEVGSPRLLASLTEDVLVIANALAGLPVLGINLVVVACTLLYVGWLSPTVLLALLVFLALGVVSYQALAGAALRRLEAARGDHDDLMKHFRGLTEGVKELKVHEGRREAFLDRLLLGTAASYRARNTTGLTLYAAAGSWGQLLFLLAVGLVVFAQPGAPYVPMAVRSGAALAILYAAGPLETVLSWAPVLGRAEVGLRKVRALGLSLAAAAEEGPAAKSLGPPRLDSLELAGVTHAYPREGEPRGFVLGPVDLTLRPGEIVFLAGGNGSGKTTLAKILTGLYAPEGGEVRLNGRPVAPGNRGEYRRLFSAVFADFYLFDRLLGLDAGGADDRARDYLDRLGLAHKVQMHDGGFSTTDLSRGQRKRLALLVACLEDRPVYVFDEWAADQDPCFKEFFYTQILPGLRGRGKAVLVITHDDRYFHVADRLVRLDEGKIEQGAPEHENVGCV